jgi:hypothetical protein
MRGMNPLYLEKLDEKKQEYILTGSGKFFADNFIFVSAEHGYVIGPTGSGKTNKMINLVSWLLHTEVIFWISASKDQDITPLFFMGLPVNIIIPKYSDIEITLDGNPLPNITYSRVSEPQDIFYAIKNDHINILEVRNAFLDRNNLLDWMIELFKLIAEWTRIGKMPKFYLENSRDSIRKSKISVFIDESQWLIAGSKVTNDPRRSKATEIISENALEIRTYGWRLIIASQGFTNIPPVIRENMACTFLCSGADVKDPPKIRNQCFPTITGCVPTALYKKKQWKFLNRQGAANPQFKPKSIPLYPKDPTDREMADRIKIKYGKTFHDQHSDSEEIQFITPFPDLGKLKDQLIEDTSFINVENTNRYNLPGDLND